MVFEDVSDLLSTKDEPQSALVPDILRLVSGLEVGIQHIDSSNEGSSHQPAESVGEDDTELALEQDSTRCGVDGQHNGVQEDEVQTIDSNLDRQTPFGPIAAVGVPNNLSGTRLTSVVELLEIILINTDVQTVLCSAQRVNKQFQSTIASSAPLQRMLHFLPAIDAGCVDPIINPLFLKASVLARLPLYLGWSSNKYTTDARLTRTTNGESGGWPDRIEAEAPTVVHKQTGTNDGAPVGTYVLLRLWPWRASSVAKKRSKNVLDAGSWRRMYLSQPPYRVVCTVPYKDHWMTPMVGVGKTRSPKTRGQMLEALWARSLKRECRTRSSPYPGADYNVPMWTMARRTK
ncbi:hypothetical protein LTR56_018609 [Elasticomyces elasticus]|nr:hypothetical protein LTR56_018609 [Elasticomyces elasticus]KAK3647363.1 hypothetical protein LTR22_013794 [Elasticomyces elasticus]KAK4917643.1 hypothetical protein LTR49_014465 [Elasticomyces elasticus]KAK5752030.1 hypothetical protein LTS12_017880 [Elasticomyces elasticus]